MLPAWSLSAMKRENGFQVWAQGLPSWHRMASFQEKPQAPSSLVRLGGDEAPPASLSSRAVAAPGGAGAQGFCGPGDRTTGVDRPSTLRAGM